MKERPILFSGPMVRAILAGRKTQTRRVVKPQPDAGVTPLEARDGSGDIKFVCEPMPGVILGRSGWIRCPYGQPGDRLWVRETFAIETDVDGNPPPFDDGRPVLREDLPDDGPHWLQCHYRATDPPPDLCCENPRCAQCRDHDFGPHWRPSIYMPRWACRLLLEVTEVRVERVQEISFEDCLAEGVLMVTDDFPPRWTPERGHPATNELELSEDLDAEIHGLFADLWDSLNAKRAPWSSNPWVWVVSFKAMEGV